MELQTGDYPGLSSTPVAFTKTCVGPSLLHLLLRVYELIDTSPPMGGDSEGTVHSKFEVRMGHAYVPQIFVKNFVSLVFIL